MALPREAKDNARLGRLVCGRVERFYRVLMEDQEEKNKTSHLEAGLPGGLCAVDISDMHIWALWRL